MKAFSGCCRPTGFGRYGGEVDAAGTANPLEQYFRHNPGRLMDKWLHYFAIYERHFHRFRGQPVSVIEFGVSHGGSAQMWKHYFGPRARITGVDIDARCAGVAEPQIEIVIGDQGDREFLRRLCDRVGPVDIVIDDGGHTMQQQLATFEVLFPSVSSQGVYLCEDLHTSYWPRFGGGYRRAGTFVEFAKGLIDQLNAWHSYDDTSFAVDDHTRSIRSMHFYDSVVVLEKDEVLPPSQETVGTPSW